MIYKDLYTEVANRLGDSSDTDLLANSKLWVNQAYNEVLRECETNTTLQWLKKRGTVTLTASTYIFPSYVGNLLSIKNSTNELDRMKIEQFDKVYPNPSVTGAPQIYVPLGVVNYASQISSSTRLSAYSSSDSDIPAGTVSATLTVRGLSAGIERYETMILSGQNIMSTVIQFDEIYSITKSVSSTGYITVTGCTNTISCVILPPERLMMEYEKIMLYPTPSSVSHTYNYLERVGDLVQDNDQPRLPRTFHELLILGATARGMVWMEDDSRAELTKGEFRRQLNNLIEYANSFDAITEMPSVEDFGVYSPGIVEV